MHEYIDSCIQKQLNKQSIMKANEYDYKKQCNQIMYGKNKKSKVTAEAITF